MRITRRNRTMTWATNLRALASAALMTVLLTGFAVTGATMANAAPADGEGRVESAPPNIVYIMLDDAGYGDFSCYGQEDFTTPNIDRIAEEGMRFTNHYSGSTVCAPTRCSLMTGLHTGHCVVRGNREVKPEGQAPMPADTVTIPRLLKKADYTTGMFGKWGLGAPGSPSDPVEHFDVFFGYNCQRQAHNYYPKHLWSNDEKVPLDGETYAHDLIVEQALKFIRDHHEGPFFAYLPVTIPHAAMHVPEESMAPFRKKFPHFENVIGRYAGPEVRNPVAAFAGMMTRLDGQVGQLMALLKELEIDDRTLVMVTSDNGPHLEGGHKPDFFDSNGPLRGHKRDLYEGGIRVPLIARWPGKITPGTESELICAHWDMLPTICELAAVEAPETDGISIVPTLTGIGDQQEHRYLYWEYSPRGTQAVRKGQWKAVRFLPRRKRKEKIELYDLSQDLGETSDVSDEHPEIVQQMLEIMRKAHVPSERFPLIRK